MNELQHQISLQSKNTFGLSSKAERFFAFDDVLHLQKLIKSSAFEFVDHYILGGGSNLLLVELINGIVLHPCLKGINVVESNSEHAILEVGAGVVWDDLVAYAVDNHLYGIENLSLIPGNVGASPVQNIGAYGVEVGHCIVKVVGCNLNTGAISTFLQSECEFGYRSSIFKTHLKNSFLITSVQFKLSKHPRFNLDYGDVKNEVEDINGGISLNTVRQAIISIRQRKLPDTSIKGNAGSFFKNPVVAHALFEKMLIQYPSMPHYILSPTEVKIPAGWLIEASGWKGKRLGTVSVHQHQALVLVNEGGASLSDVLKLSSAIELAVLNQFGVKLEREVNIMGKATSF